MKKYAVIVAGGSGQRMGAPVPKQFLLLKGKPVLLHTIERFLSVYADLQAIVVLPEDHLDYGRDLVAGLGEPNRVTIVKGGITRFESVCNGLQRVEGSAIIFVHDGVRCLVSKQLVARCYEQALEKGSAIPAVAAIDSIRIDDGVEHKTVDREKVHIIQTPQTFTSEIILPAFQQEYHQSFTDEANVVEAYGEKVYLIEGDYNNLKITKPIDLLIAEKLLEDLPLE